jgi:transcriptional regulator with XRE-family HTH domain
MMSDSIPPEQQAANQEAGKRLREIRQKAGMSQEDVSFAAEIDQSALSKAERLGPQVVSWQKLFAIADALGCLVEVSFRPK